MNILADSGCCHNLYGRVSSYSPFNYLCLLILDSAGGDTSCLANQMEANDTGPPPKTHRNLSNTQSNKSKMLSWATWDLVIDYAKVTL